MKRVIFKAIVLTFILSNSAIAQQRDLWTTFTTADGLADNNVVASIESRYGALWFGTSGGVSRYQDGMWTTFTVTDGLATNVVFAMLESRDGALWFGTSGGASRYQDSTWTTYTITDGLTANRIDAIFESRDGALWFGTPGGVSHYQNGTWTTFTTADGLAGNRVVAILESRDGALWFGTLDGVSCYQDGFWTTFTTADGLASNDAYAILESRDGALWFGTGGGVSRHQDGIWTTFTTADGLAHNFVLAILESRDGALWFGTPGGVSRYQDDTWRTFTAADGLANDVVTALLESRDGALWFGTRAGGVSRYQEGIWVTLTNADGIAGNNVYAIIESHDGALWFGTLGGVSRYQDGIWTNFTTADGLATNVVFAMLESRDGALWFGTINGVSRYQDGIWTTFTTADGLAYDCINTILESRDGALWFGTGRGVSRYQDGIWTNFTTANGLIDSTVYASIESRDGALWFGTLEGGVIRYQYGAWKTFTTADGLADNSVYAILESRDGALWFGTRGGGVSRYHEGIWVTFTTADGLAGNHVNAILESSDGALWFGTDGGGVSRFQEDIWVTFTTADGLAGNKVNAILESRDGTLWFGTNGQGVSRLKPDKIPPITFIYEGPDNIIIGTLNHQFRFGGLDFRTPIDQLYYSYAIVKHLTIPESRDWWPFSTSTAVLIPPLQNGTYTFHVRARDAWGNIDPKPETRTFTVDITQPTVTILSPAPESVIAGQTAMIGSAFDNSPIKDFDFYELNYGAFISDDIEPEWRKDQFLILNSTSEVRNDTLGIFNTIGLEDRDYQIRVWARDTLGHTGEDKVLVTVDNTPPLVEITSPLPQDAISDAIDIRANVADANLDKFLLEYKMPYHIEWQPLYEKQLEQSIADQTIFVWSNDSDSGDVYLRLTAWDKAGNTDTATVNFVLNNLDFQKPTAAISYPPNNDYLNGLVSINGFVTDENLVSYTLALKGQKIDTVLVEDDSQKENEPLYFLDTRIFPDGNYELILTVINAKLHQSRHVISIVIDNTPPLAQLTSPSSDTVSCCVQLEGEAFDQNFAGMTLKYAKATETDASKYILIDTTFSDWNTIDLDGTYTLYLSVKDKGGLETVDTRSYFIDNPRFEKGISITKKQGEFSLFIPPNGYQSSKFCLEKVGANEFNFAAQGIAPTDLIVDIQTSIEQATFDKPGILTIDYSNLSLDQRDENKLKIHVWENQQWRLVGGTLDKDKKVATTVIKRKGIYGLFESTDATKVASVNKALRLEAQPRVFSPQGGGFSNTTALSFELNKETNVTIKIYNAAGRLVRVLTENEPMAYGTQVKYWDGKDQSGHYCLSGLHLVTIQAEDKMVTKTIVVLNK